MEKKKRKPNGYWTKERCHEEALKYDKRSDFNRYSHTPYMKSLNNGWLDDFCKHMKVFQKPNGYWTYEKCKEEASKYDNKKDFLNNSSTAHKKAQLNGWMRDICGHMNRKVWTHEKVENEAKKYSKRNEFKKKSGGAFNYAKRHNILNNICEHMVNNNDSKRCIYAYEFNNNSVYVGLTNDLMERNYKHLKIGTVYKNIQKTNFTPKPKQLTNYLDVNIAQFLEEYYVNYYKNNEWKILNIAKTGGIGSGVLYWTKERCQKEALNYNTRNEFKKGSRSAYTSAHKNKWIDEICEHMISPQKPSGYWSYEKCRSIALKYVYIEDFSMNEQQAYRKSKEKKWLDDFNHLKSKGKFKFDKEKCRIEALKYNNKKDFKDNAPSHYRASYRYKWLNEICSHMD